MMKLIVKLGFEISDPQMIHMKKRITINEQKWLLNLIVQMKLKMNG